jgi:hypothetical protein
VGRDKIQTERVNFGAFPKIETLVKEAIELADVVVYSTYTKRRGLPKDEGAVSEWLDCVKGEIKRMELAKLINAGNPRADSLIFISGAGDDRKVVFSYDCSYHTFHGPFGEFRLASNKDHPIERDLRWHLAREAAPEPRAEDSLRALNPAPARGEWAILELVLGTEKPEYTFKRPVTRSGRDGGEALFSIILKSGDKSVELKPQGRFGADSFFSKEPEGNDVLGIDYQFIASANGVIKLAIRPRQDALKVEATAVITRYAATDHLGIGTTTKIQSAAVPIEWK